MVFNSFVFLFAFLPIVLGGYFALPRTARLHFLTAASYVFYGYWRADFVLLLAALTLIAYTAGAAIARSPSPRQRKLALIGGVAANLGLLGYFKYAGFASDTINAGLSVIGLPPLAWGSVLLPIGISFLVFHGISYVVDVYRGTVRPAENLLLFAAYMSLFPQLVAGPVVRFAEVGDQLRHPMPSVDRFGSGVLLFMVGFSKKVLLANTLAGLADAGFALAHPNMLQGWFGLVAFTFQIYFDFSGYTDMAIGLGLMFGLTFPQNFNSPYQADSITDFWRRWHMTLSRFLRDYLYIPLGGNRYGAMRTGANLMITMVLGGLWHGAAWTFVLWGAYQGLFLALERWNRRQPVYAALPRAARIACTFIIVMLGWVPFRAKSVAAMSEYYAGLFGANGIGSTANVAIMAGNQMLIALAVSALIVFGCRNSWSLQTEPLRLRHYAQFAAFAIAVLELVNQGFTPFIYFQF